jgi:hypothetical protein
MRVAYSYDNVALACHKGSVVRKIFAGSDLHQPFANVLPGLTKLQLLPILSSARTFYTRPGRPGDYWYLRWLPAQHICETIPRGRDLRSHSIDRNQSSTLMTHRSGEDGNTSFRQTSPEVGEAFLVSLKDPIWSSSIFTQQLPHDDPSLWDPFHDRIGRYVQDQLGDVLGALDEDTVFELYGWLSECLHPHLPGSTCECQDEREEFSKIANEKQSPVTVLTGNREWPYGPKYIPIKVKLGMPNERPACVVCGGE